MRLLILIILILLLIGALPTWPYSAGWGYFPSGGIGLLGTAPSQDVIEGCDTLLMVGTSYPYMEYLPKPGSAKCVQIDSNAQRIGLRYPAEVGLVGDSRKTLRELIARALGWLDFDDLRPIVTQDLGRKRSRQVAGEIDYPYPVQRRFPISF